MPITPSKASSGRKRRWNAPPPLTRGIESLEGEQVLIEHADPAAVVLWQTGRNVTLWAATDPRHRDGLFRDEARSDRLEAIEALGPGHPVREPLLQLTTLLGSPGDGRSRAIAQACREIAEWAIEHDKPATALFFMQAGALAAPRNAELAFRVGSIARQHAQFARAESWFRQAITLGRQAGDWTAYTLAYVGLADIQMRRGSLPAARRSLVKAMRAARRKGLEEEALSLHALQRVSALSGRHGEAEQYAKEAFEAYGEDNPNVSRLALDVARARVLAGSYGHAMPLLEALYEKLEDTDLRLLLLGALARAKSGMSDREGYEAASVEARTLLDAHPDTVSRAQVWLDLAHAAGELRRWKEVERAATRAAEAAESDYELRIQREADTVREAASEGRAPDADQLTQDGDDRLDDQLLETIGSGSTEGTP